MHKCSECKDTSESESAQTTDSNSQTTWTSSTAAGSVPTPSIPVGANSNAKTNPKLIITLRIRKEAFLPPESSQPTNKQHLEADNLCKYCMKLYTFSSQASFDTAEEKGTHVRKHFDSNNAEWKEVNDLTRLPRHHQEAFEQLCKDCFPFVALKSKDAFACITPPINCSESAPFGKCFSVVLHDVMKENTERHLQSNATPKPADDSEEIIYIETKVAAGGDKRRLATRYKCKACKGSVSTVVAHLFTQHYKSPVVRCPHCIFASYFNIPSVLKHIAQEHPESNEIPIDARMEHKDEIRKCWRECVVDPIPYDFDKRFAGALNRWMMRDL